jgi:hypothetical protein
MGLLPLVRGLPMRLTGTEDASQWVYMAVYSCMWLYMAVYGRIWLYMLVYGCIWFYMAVFGHIWLYMAVHGCIWLTLVLKHKGGGSVEPPLRFDTIWHHPPIS